MKLLDEYNGASCYITEKLDGTSATFFINNNEFGVCSRNMELEKRSVVGVLYHDKAVHRLFVEVLEDLGYKVNDYGFAKKVLIADLPLPAVILIGSAAALTEVTFKEKKAYLIEHLTHPESTFRNTRIIIPTTSKAPEAITQLIQMGHKRKVVPLPTINTYNRIAELVNKEVIPQRTSER